METVDNQQLLLFRKLENGRVLLLELLIRQWMHLAKRFVEPFFELFTGAENLGKQKV